MVSIISLQTTLAVSVNLMTITPGSPAERCIHTGETSLPVSVGSTIETVPFGKIMNGTPGPLSAWGRQMPLKGDTIYKATIDDNGSVQVGTVRVTSASYQALFLSDGGSCTNQRHPMRTSWTPERVIYALTETDARDRANRFVSERRWSNNQGTQVAIGFLLRDSKVLVGKRNYNSRCGGLWEFPGGKLELGETYEQALCREWLEELDLVIYLGNLLYEQHLSAGSETPAFVARTYQVYSYGDPLPMGPHSELRWVTFEELRRLPLTPSGGDALVNGHLERSLRGNEFLDP